MPAGWAEVNIFYPQGEQRQQYNHRLLFVPGYVVGNGQVVQVIQAESLFQCQRNLYQRVAVVALPASSTRGIPLMSPSGSLL